jgi:hypothetical protein
MDKPTCTSDRGGRFYLGKQEQCPHCAGIREPSRAFPFSQMKHGRSVVHVAALFGADPLQVKRAVKAIKEAEVNGIPASAHARLALAEKIGKILKPRNP